MSTPAPGDTGRIFGIVPMMKISCCSPEFHLHALAAEDRVDGQHIENLQPLDDRTKMSKLSSGLSSDPELTTIVH